MPSSRHSADTDVSRCAIRRLAAKARAGATEGGCIEDRILRVDRTEAAVPDAAADLVTDL